MSVAILRAAPGFADQHDVYQGLPGPGVPNLTPRIGPPGHPQPEEQQGVGRGPGERWEHRTHNVTVNPYWYLDRPYIYDVPADALNIPVSQTRKLPIAFALQVYELEIHERQVGASGLAGVDAAIVVPAPPAYTQTELRRLAPHA
jgi:hypothetical protein